MFASPTLSPEERDLVLQEAKKGPQKSRIPVRKFGSSNLQPPGKGGKESGRRKPPENPKSRSKDAQPPKRRRKRRRAILITSLLLIIFGSLGFIKVLSVGNAILSPDRSMIAQLADVLFRKGALLGEEENRINILLVAIGGEGHKGENLADTIILASIRPNEKDVALLSIPRDLYVEIPGSELFSRINAVHAYGEQKAPGKGLAMLKEKITEISGQPVHYVARVDFLAFKKIVDEIGGVDIAIDNSFYDYWHKISFPAGTEKMNGERALAYVRARYIEGPEGGDFKRAERTQQVLLAIRNKMLSAHTVVDIRALSGILDALKDHVATSFTLSELKKLADLTGEISNESIHSTVLTTGKDGLLVGTTEILGGRPAAVLRPRAGLQNYEEVHKLAANIFNEAEVITPPSEEIEEPVATPEPSPTPEPETVETENPSLEIRNGTNVSGLAGRTSAALEQEGFTTSSVGNAAIKSRTQTIVIDLSEGKKAASLKSVLSSLGLSSASDFPEAEKQPADVDFIIFLGTDVTDKFSD